MVDVHQFHSVALLVVLDAGDWVLKVGEGVAENRGRTHTEID